MASVGRFRPCPSFWRIMYGSWTAQLRVECHSCNSHQRLRKAAKLTAAFVNLEQISDIDAVDSTHAVIVGLARRVGLSGADRTSVDYRIMQCSCSG